MVIKILPGIHRKKQPTSLSEKDKMLSRYAGTTFRIQVALPFNKGLARRLEFPASPSPIRQFPSKFDYDFTLNRTKTRII